MSIYKWVDKEVVIDTGNGILLSHKKELSWVSPSEVDESRAYIYVCVCVCVCIKWYWWTYFQGRNRDIDIENKLVGTIGEGEGGTNRKSSMETYTLPYVNTSWWDAVV